ncbi:hypothetical protein [Listeria monocytogenes]|uniref:hypothetical protein n=1 Tax=Listeria monocytogenes TaxID=1639 RepID=UPI001E44E575|nr:hypothetical protein [Listeria monocytogenes]MCD2223041.1 hypothetical protein [Listeria monocytogenes]
MESKHDINIRKIRNSFDIGVDVNLYPISIKQIKPDYYYLDSNGVTYSMRGKEPKVIKCSDYGYLRFANEVPGNPNISMVNYDVFKRFLTPEEYQYIRDNWDLKNECLKEGTAK